MYSKYRCIKKLVIPLSDKTAGDIVFKEGMEYITTDKWKTAEDESVWLEVDARTQVRLDSKTMEDYFRPQEMEE